MVQRNRLLISGTMGASEVWSTGFTFAENGTGAVIVDQEILQTWADNVAAAIPVLIDGSLENYLSTAVTITQITAQSYPPAGNVGLQAIAPVAAFAGGGTVKCPFQTAMVYSLRTTLPGASFRGRNYWPAVGATIESTGVFNATDVEASPARMVTLLQGIADAAGESIELAPQVYSPTRDLLTPVSRISVGNVPDTQRRRRDNIIEQYTTADYPSA